MVYINSSDEYNIYVTDKNITDLKAIPKFWLDHEKEMKYFTFDLSYARETTRMFFFNRVRRNLVSNFVMKMH